MMCQVPSAMCHVSCAGRHLTLDTWHMTQHREYAISEYCIDERRQPRTGEKYQQTQN